MDSPAHPTPSQATPEKVLSITVSPSQRRPRAKSLSILSKDSGFLFAVTWITGVLAAAAALVFGIWAPLSYKATADGNRDNNAAQSAVMSCMSSMIGSISSANSIASAALSSASAQNRQLSAMGQLALIDFCASRTVNYHLLFISTRQLVNLRGSHVLLLLKRL